MSLVLKHKLLTLHLLFLPLELVFFFLSLYPVLVGNLGQHLSVLLFLLFVLLFLAYLALLNLLLDLFFLLFDETVFEPLLELNEGNLLSLLLLELFLVFLLLLDELFVVDVHHFAVFPLVHGVGPLLHPKCFFLLLLNQSLKEVSLGLNYQLLSKFGFMILSSGPLFMCDLDGVILYLKDAGCI